MNSLVVEGLAAGYGAVTVLHDVSIKVCEGEFIALLGTNGNGKSTLLNTILGFTKPTDGRVRLEWDGNSVDLTGLPPYQVVQEGIALVPEGRRLVPNLTVEETLLLAGSGPRAKKSLRSNLEFCFSTFQILRERRNQLASTMSGGQQQLLAIARALMTSPRVIIIDEPSVGLAPIVVGQVFEAIRTLQATRGLTVLMAEQSFFQAIDIASRAYILAHGRIIRSIENSHDLRDHDEIRRAMMGVVAA